jgi:hypothetical protein
VPEDRLKSAVPFMGGVIPTCMLVYGWCIEKRKGGVAVPVLAMFIQGVAQLFCFPSLNVYCLDVNPKRSAEVVGKWNMLACSADNTNIRKLVIMASDISLGL